MPSSFTETVQSNSGTKLTATDIQRNSSIPASFFEAVTVKAGGKPSLTGVFTANDAPLAKSGVKPSGSETAVMHDGGTVKSGVVAACTSANGYIETGQVKSGVKPSGLDLLGAVDAPAGRSGLRPSVTDAGAFHDAGQTNTGVKPVVVDTVAALGVLQVRSGLNVSGSFGIFSALDTSTVKTGAKPSSADLLTMIDGGLVKSGSKALPSTGEALGHVETGQVNVGGRVSAVDTIAGHDTVTVKTGAMAVGAGAGDPRGLFTPESVNVAPLVLLIRQLRKTIHATLTEIVEIPETQDNPPNAQLPTPFLAIVGHAPHPAESAVFDQTQTFTFDFVYVTRDVEAGVVDVQEYVRDRLRTLKRALMLDYRQSGAANTSRLVADPGETGNRYKSIFTDVGQPVTALEMTMEFDVIESLL